MFLYDSEEEFKSLFYDEEGRELSEDEIKKRSLEVYKWVPEKRLASPYWFLYKTHLLDVLLKLYLKYGEGEFVIRQKNPNYRVDGPEMLGLTPEEISYAAFKGRILEVGNSIIVEVDNWKGHQGDIPSMFVALFFKPNSFQMLLVPVEACLMKSDEERNEDMYCASLIPSKGFLRGYWGTVEHVNYKVKLEE